jgi:hypothetical protein
MIALAPPEPKSAHNAPMARYGTVSMTAVPIHSAIVISKLKTRRSVLSMSAYVNEHSGWHVLICDCFSQ